MPITFIGSDENPSPEIARYALTYCDRTVISMSTRTLESKDFLNFVFRNADWSPPGVDKMSRLVKYLFLICFSYFRTIFSCVTGNRQLLICARDLNAWTCMANLSTLWNAYWKSQGLRILAENQQKFVTLKGEWNNQSEDDTSPLECETIQEFFSSIAESSFMLSSWSLRLRQSEGKIPRFNALLAALHKSGSISFWDISVPMIDRCAASFLFLNIFVVEAFALMQLNALTQRNLIHQTSAPGQISSKFLITTRRIVSLLYHTSSEGVLLVFLVVGFTNGRVICVSYQAYAKHAGRICVERVSEHVLNPRTDAAVAVGDAAYTNGILAVAHGTRVVVATVATRNSICALASLSDEAILKPISGLCISKTHVYFSSQDGIIGRAAIPTQINSKFKN